MTSPEITLSRAAVQAFEDYLTHDGDVGENLSLPMKAQLALCRLALKSLDQPAPPSADVVEAVARVIAPGAWEVMDGYRKQMLSEYKGKSIGYPVDQFQDKESMAIARAAIRALSEANLLKEQG